MENTNELLKKYFKNYIDGKKMYNKNKEKSLNYFQDSLEILENLKKNHLNKIKKHNKILEESENDCYKYINLTIESTIDQENMKLNFINNNNLLNELEKGDLDLIKSAKFRQINFNEYIKDDTILHLAIKYGDTLFLKYAFKLGARIDTTNKLGNTLLEYACIQNDPNMINFLDLYGANMQKHLYFRSGDDKFVNNNNSIDICILLKIILSYLPNENDDNQINNKIYNKIKLLENLLNLNASVNLNNYTYKDLLCGLMHFLNKIPEENAISYLNIIIEELNYVFSNKLGCPCNKLELILTNIVPFIDYPFNLSIDWVIILELKYLIINLIKKKKKYNNLNIKEDLTDLIWNIYIKNEIIQEDYLGCLISQWITKIKV